LGKKKKKVALRFKTCREEREKRRKRGERGKCERLQFILRGGLGCRGEGRGRGRRAFVPVKSGTLVRLMSPSPMREGEGKKKRTVALHQKGKNCILFPRGRFGRSAFASRRGGGRKKKGGKKKGTKGVLLRRFKT